MNAPKKGTALSQSCVELPTLFFLSLNSQMYAELNSAIKKRLHTLKLLLAGCAAHKSTYAF